MVSSIQREFRMCLIQTEQNNDSENSPTVISLMNDSGPPQEGHTEGPNGLTAGEGMPIQQVSQMAPSGSSSRTLTSGWPPRPKRCFDR